MPVTVEVQNVIEQPAFFSSPHNCRVCCVRAAIRALRMVAFPPVVKAAASRGRAASDERGTRGPEKAYSQLRAQPRPRRGRQRSGD